ncbi:alpha-galactosidase [Demequina sp. NBRC 110056]|uniref:alpha-galactosidase n=1 Tax=Demequina sp. NBRC 110056 TaxID=1570345 RepID=UPI000A01BE10|nr:alpha-galactosidase [Demequina sp. NBRC 110056]
MSDLIHLRDAGVSLVLDTRGGRLPRIVHWGADLGETMPADLEQLAIADDEPRVGGGELDDRYGVAILPEHSWGWFGTPGLEGHREGRDHATRFTVTEVARSVEGDGDARVQRVSVRAADALADLALDLTIELLGSGLVRARGALTSTGHGSSDTEAPYVVDALSLLLPAAPEATEILDFSGRWIRERTPQRHAWVHGTHLREGRRGKPGHDTPFLVAAGTAGFGFRSGEVWATHVAWSGNTRWLAERGMHGKGLLGGGELPFAGEIRLAPGETYEGPWTYWAHGTAGLDSVAERFHRHLRSLPSHPSTPRPVTVNTWEAVYFDHDHAKLYALADAAAAVGAERFVLDDGWFNHRRADNAGLGDWFVDAGVYPDGLAPLADYVRAQGLEFGLWFEPEMINPDSDLAREHPEWIAQPELASRRAEVGGEPRLPLEARQQQVLDLTHPEAYAYIEERLHALIAEVRPAYLKWDHNRDLLEAGSSATGRAIGHEQTLAFYRLLDGIHAAFPGIEIETCAGGGGRVDLEVLSRTQRIWASDCNDPLERQRIQQWTSLVVPPEMMGAHIGPPEAHSTGRAAGLDFRGGTALWGHLGIEWNVASADASVPAVRAALTAWVALHKEHRDLLHSGTVVHSDLPEPGRVLHGVVATDLSEALYGFASVDSVHTNPVGALRLPGLDPAARYRVVGTGPADPSTGATGAATAWWTDGVELTGRALAVHGVQAPGIIPEQVILIRVTRVG